MAANSSKRRFAEYREQIKQRPRNKLPPTPHTVADAPEGPRQRTFGRLFWDFVRLLRGHRGKLAFALATLTAATVLKLAPPAATKFVVDYVLGDAPMPAAWTSRLPLPTDRMQLLWLAAGGVVAAALTAAALHLWGRWYATQTVNRLQVGLRKRVFEHAVRLPLHEVYKLKSGGAASLLREDAGGASELVFNMLYNPWQAVVQLAGSLAVLVLVDWRMMVGAIVLLPLVYLTHRTWINRIRPLYRDVRNQRQQIDGYSTEAFGGMRIVRGFARERSESARFVGQNNLLIRQQLFVWCWARMIDLAWSAIIPLSSAALLLYGGYQILHGRMTLGDLTMFLFYLVMLLDPIATLAASATNFQNNLAGLDRVLDLLEQPRDMPPREGAVSLKRGEVAGRLSLHDVSFAYPGSERLVLRNIDLDIAPGETLALVGRSGAGKTTLCNLAARFYDPTEGSLELDGRDLRDIEVESYRRLLGIVEQDVFLFDGTIADNIGYGRRGATNDQIEAAARAANAHEFIAPLTDGYDSLIGERGVKLSGGQRQRLAIARALLADPRILILDEATSNLDSESEQLIQQSLQALMQDRTCFVIAHRMSTIALADRIAVLDDGELIELGTHDELMSRSSAYRRMVELQTSAIAERF